ncbi:FAD-dependent oxidoreductase [Megasphaera paucivorans]|uniref:Dihydrolipoamide dehydrogenase n=1 Tax=Megasphaera paucivorans TaxID=349095 RepID=A0A1G9UFE3_9FIRM|nr:FAD-dependent oxidoreductase [Megasphaera paucivorans]SDM58533.1 dihydrolipoamide dehydrogenase [Megasphaera paucivorans]
MKNYDVIIIGTGAANIVADAAARQGLKIAIIERGRFGGTCLNRGCIPTKIMVTAANYIREFREASQIGVLSEHVRMDWQVVSKRLWKKVDESHAVKEYYAAMPTIDIYEGTASFIDKKSLHIEMNDGSAAEISGSKIILGIGARTNVPALPGLEETGYITSESLFGTNYPPQPYKSLIIVGGGPIGCEFAHVFDAAGTKVTIVQHNVRLLPKEDESISQYVLDAFHRYGIQVFLNQDTVSVHMEKDKKVLSFRNRTTGEEQEVSAQEILIAPGIVPMTDLLHLEHTDISLDKRGYINTNEFLETSAEDIWALGDVNGLAPFRHKANYEAEIIAHNIFSGNEPDTWRWAQYETVPAVTYTYPEAAHVGLTEKQARNANYEIDIAINHFSASAKGYAMGYEPGDSNDGFVKLVIDKKTKNILGVHIIGPQASILLQPFINLLSCGQLTVEVLHEEIASPAVKMLRHKKLTRNLDPHSVITMGESMTPHPSLSEVTMWTRYYYEGK